MDSNGYWYSGIHGQIFWVGYGYTQSIPYPWPFLITSFVHHENFIISLNRGGESYCGQDLNSMQ